MRERRPAYERSGTAKPPGGSTPPPPPVPPLPVRPVPEPEWMIKLGNGEQAGTEDPS